MRRTFAYVSAALTFCLLMLTLSLNFTTTTVKAVQPPDPCVKCQAKVQKRLDQCEAQHGGPAQVCYDEFNQGIVDCYATVCEQ
jgi:hypothetical protein